MRRLLIAAAVLAVLALVTAVAVGHWLSGGELREVVEARLTATLGQPVAMGRLGISLFPRFALTGEDVRVGEARAQAPAVDIGRVRIVPRLRPLLNRRVVVEQVDLEGFVVSLLRDEKGQWHVPAAVPAATGDDGSTAVIERVRVSGGRVRVFDRTRSGEVAESASIDDLEADVIAEAGALQLSGIAGRIGRAPISGQARADARAVVLEFATGDIEDEDLPVFLRLLGSQRPEFLRLAEAASASVTIRVDRASARLSGKGMLRAPQVVLEPLRLSEFEAPFAIDGGRLQFSPTTFSMYGGRHRGALTIHLTETPPAWATDSRMSELAVGPFLNTLTGRDQRVDGTASASALLRGRVGEPLERTMRGRMQVTVANGVVRQFPLLATINRALRLAESEGNDTRFERLSATWTIASGEATTDDLVLDAGHVRVAAAGRIAADRSLALRGTAVVSAERAARAVASVHEFARLRNSRGEFEVPLTISGTLDAPSFGLDLNAAVRKGLADELRRRLRRFIRPPD